MATITKVSPLAPAAFPDLPVIDGVTFATTAAGVKYLGRTDVMLALLAPGTTVAGVFTKSATRAAPVLDCQAKLGEPSEGPAAILVNSGNANAFTGKGGVAAVEAITAAVSATCGVDQNRVFTSSTGVIGEPLPAERITTVLETLHQGQNAGHIAEAAQAIMTTDTFPKGAGKEVEIDGKTVSIAGIAKGSGMIAPDMATMLAFVFTDADIPAPVLQHILTKAADRSFNATTVDGDTSTSDTLLAFATGAAAGHPKIERPGARILKAFRNAFEDICVELAQAVVKDGEGAQKFVTIKVTGAQSSKSARRIGLSIANSPLVKTAIAGEDANWGRIVMAVGKAGEPADRDALQIKIGGVPITEDGNVRGDYDEGPVAELMKRRDIVSEVDVGIGKGKGTVWTCDLTHGYIDINADYRS